MQYSANKKKDELFSARICEKEAERCATKVKAGRRRRVAWRVIENLKAN